MRHPIGPLARRLALIGLVCIGTVPQLPAQATPTPSPVMNAPGMKSPAVAFMASLLGTGIPLLLAKNDADGTPAGLLLFSVLLGPSIGHFYAGAPLRAFTGIGIRAGIMAFTVAAAGASAGDCANSDDFLCIPTVLVVGLVAEGVAMVADIVTAPVSASRANRKRVQPFVTALRGSPGKSGRLGIGMEIALGR